MWCGDQKEKREQKGLTVERCGNAVWRMKYVEW